MLLREFAIENHTISLIQEDDLYIAKVTDKNGKKIVYQEYEDYEKIKSCFDEIVQAIDKDKIGIKDVIVILERNPV
ncbi:MAG: hypothetical protein APF77_11235 [Clostridia bacterium BRH_c25]|nr:MAG: hypothetical protein APF77_11235 [Clostridia bacterium BRH_c25]